jgi:bifunctional DNase/RNase
MVQVTVARLGLDSSTNTYVVVLRERDGQRLLPIWIGQPEAESIAMELNHVQRERPMTHDLCRSLITGLGGVLRQVTITRVHQSTFYAELVLDGPAGAVVIDARPSDSIAIALRLEAPIFVPDWLLTGLPDAEPLEPPEGMPTSELTPEQLKRYLEQLRPEDFGRFLP